MMKLFEHSYQKETNEFYLNLLSFKQKALFSAYFSNIDSSLLPKFYFRTMFAINEGALIWIEFIVGKYILSFNFIQYKKWGVK